MIFFNCRALVASIPFYTNAESAFVSDVVCKLKYEVFQPGNTRHRIFVVLHRRGSRSFGTAIQRFQANVRVWEVSFLFSLHKKTTYF